MRDGLRANGDRRDAPERAFGPTPIEILPRNAPDSGARAYFCWQNAKSAPRALANHCVFS
jgi:hypothetical protein